MLAKAHPYGAVDEEVFAADGSAGEGEPVSQFAFSF